MRRHLLLSAVTAVLALAAAGPAAAAPPTVVMYSDPGDYVGQGTARAYEGRDEVRVTGGRRELTISVDGAGGNFDIELTPPAGRSLRKGSYRGAQRSSFRSRGRPGIDISGNGRGCNEVEGSFLVRRLETSSGRVRRAVIGFEQHCEGDVAALWGEIRIGVGAPAGALRPLIASARFPTREVRSRSAPVPVTFAARRAVRPAGARITGPGRRDYQVRLDECRARQLRARGRCQVFVRFAPRHAGTRRATLLIGGTRVALRGTAPRGRSSVVLRSERGDRVGQGRTYRYSAANATIVASGNRRRVHFAILGRGDRWDADFEAPADDILAPGLYRHAARYPFNDDAPGLAFSGNGRGCNEITGSFRVLRARFGPGGALRSFAVRFTQRCDGGKGVLRGDLRYRVPVP